MKRNFNLVCIFFSCLIIFSISCQKQSDNSSGDIQALKTSVSALQKTTDSLSKALAASNANITSLSLRVDSIKTQIVVIQNQISILTTQITVNNTNITVINNQLVVLNQQYLDLLKLLNEILAQLSVVPTTISTGLVAYYPFTGNANDSSGNSNHGTTIGVTLTADRFGNPNSAYSFAGNNNSYIDCGSGPTIKVQKNISVSVWFYMNGGYINPRMLDFQGTGNGGYYLSSTGSSNNPRTVSCGFINDIGTGGISDVPTILPSLVWSHLVYECDSTGLSKLYLNGKIINSTQGASINTIPYNGLTLNIGRNNHPSYDAWGGYLDDIRIYNRILTDSEITFLATH